MPEKSRAEVREELGSLTGDDGGPDLEEILSRPCGFCLKIMQGGRP